VKYATARTTSDPSTSVHRSARLPRSAAVPNRTTNATIHRETNQLGMLVSSQPNNATPDRNRPLLELVNSPNAGVFTALPR